MPFRTAFDCLWCGRRHEVRGPEELEGWAQLCPDCVGRAGENEFVRFRVREALAERARQRSGAPVAAATVSASPSLRSLREDEDWYARRGAHSEGPIHDAAWHAELDAAGRWLDEVPIEGEIVELVAGVGWWSPLLAPKGSLTVHDASDASLERARRRLLAHGLRAHLHRRDPSAEPDRQVDALFAGFWLGAEAASRLDESLGLARRWLRPRGTFAFVDLDPGPAPREALVAALGRAGFDDAEVSAIGRFLVVGRGRAGPSA